MSVEWSNRSLTDGSTPARSRCGEWKRVVSKSVAIFLWSVLKQYGTARYFDTDAFLNPADMVEDVKAIFLKNPVIRQYECPHDCLLAPFDDGTAVNYKILHDFLFA